eukprot:1677829-Rhodomonas_salina.1
MSDRPICPPFLCPMSGSLTALVCRCAPCQAGSVPPGLRLLVGSDALPTDAVRVTWGVQVQEARPTYASPPPPSASLPPPLPPPLPFASLAPPLPPPPGASSLPFSSTLLVAPEMRFHAPPLPNLFASPSSPS